MRLQRWISAVSAVYIAALGINDAQAAARIPASDSQVLEHLPFKPSDPLARELGQLRSALRNNPNNQDLAVKLASRYYNMVAEEGDPRYLGYAQAALAPWWDLPQPPTEVQLLRARLRQFQHDFSGSLSDLDQIIRREPQNASAHALRAIIHIVQARYKPARIDCLALKDGKNDLIALGCTSMVDGLTGRAGQAYALLQSAFDAHPGASAEEKLWILLRLAELAQRRGQRDIAEAHYKQALTLGITDTFLLAAYADLLLNQKRPAEVVALLKDKLRSDVLLLRLVFAERALNLPSATEREAALAARYAAAQLRGDTVHQQEEARFVLAVQKDAKKALWLAQENWMVQREPPDARIFLEAALAANDVSGAQPVLAWLAESRIEDPVLQGLGRQLQGGAK